jgi:hypothetical protein
MPSQLLFGPTFVDGVRPELVSAIMEMLTIYPRAMCGMCEFQPALTLRLSADEQEVSAALAAMESARLIERVRVVSPILQWRLPASPEHRSSAFLSGQAVGAAVPLQASGSRPCRDLQAMGTTVEQLGTPSPDASALHLTRTH